MLRPPFLSVCTYLCFVAVFLRELWVENAIDFVLGFC